MVEAHETEFLSLGFEVYFLLKRGPFQNGDPLFKLLLFCESSGLYTRIYKIQIHSGSNFGISDLYLMVIN